MLCKNNLHIYHKVPHGMLPGRSKTCESIREFYVYAQKRKVGSNMVKTQKHKLWYLKECVCVYVCVHSALPLWERGMGGRTTSKRGWEELPLLGAGTKQQAAVCGRGRIAGRRGEGQCQGRGALCVLLAVAAPLRSRGHTPGSFDDSFVCAWRAAMSRLCRLSWQLCSATNRHIHAKKGWRWKLVDSLHKKKKKERKSCYMFAPCLG